MSRKKGEAVDAYILICFNPTMTWQESVKSAIERVVANTGSSTFNRQYLINTELERILREVDSAGATPDQTLSRVLQELRDQEIIEFDSPGVYRLREEKDISFEDEDANSQTSEIDADDIPKEQRFLRTQAYDKSINDIIGMIENGDIILDPEYQRNYVWDNKKASLLVESILLNVPIPVVYVAEDIDSRWNVVDGLQRLFSLKRFFLDEFKLRGLEVLSELNGLQYSALNPKAARILRNGILRIILIFKESHPEIKYEIFMRLNRGAIKLKEEELRNCLYRGSLNSLLKKLKTNALFLKILGLKKPHKRMDDEELILRFLMISENYDPTVGEVTGYTGKIKSSLNKFMETRRNPDETTLVSYERRFSSTIEKVYSVFGENAFRKVNSDGSFENRPNRAIMDFIMVSFDTRVADLLLQKKDSIVGLLQTLPANDTNFESSITISTSDKRQLEYRLNTWNRELDLLLSQ